MFKCPESFEPRGRPVQYGFCRCWCCTGTILYSYRVYVQFICYYINMHSAIIQYHAIIIIYISYRIMYYNICDHVRYGTMQYDDDDKLYFVF